MTVKRWLGQAVATYDIWTISLSGTVTSQTYTITINSKTVTFIAGGSDTVASVLAGLVANWNLSNAPPEFGELTPAVSGTTIVATANLAGNPCTITVGTSGGATFTIAHTQAATGPNDFTNALNWSGGVAPANGDTLVFDNGSASCKYNISSSLTGITLLVNPGFSGNIGLSFINQNSNTTYNEYRTTALTLTGGTVTINAPSLTLCSLAFGANTATVQITATGRRTSQYTPVVLITGGNGSSKLAITKGDVGVAFYQGQTATFPTILTSYQNSATSDVTLFCGSGCTLTTVTQDGGNVTTNSSVTTFTQGVGGGTATFVSGSVTTLYVEAGTAVWNSTGTLGTATVAGKGLLDFSQDPNGKTVTNPILVYGDVASVNDPWKVVNSGVLSVTTNQTQMLNVSHGSGNVCTFT